MYIKNNFLLLFLIASVGFACSGLLSSCGQIGMPTGGLKDTLAPVLVKAEPIAGTTFFTGNKITLTFNEYIEVLDVQKNVLVSPYQKKNPVIKSNLKTVTIKLKDTLLPNTTYSINFGNAIKDVNEGNIYKEYTYLFSTGAFIDSFTLNGTVEMAETGKVDTTVMLLLYRNAVDSSVQKLKPNYIARVKADGSFNFLNLPAGNFKVYALKDEDGSKNYNSKKEAIGFLADNKTIVIGPTNPSLKLYASALVKETNTNLPKKKTVFEKKLKFSVNQAAQQQELTTPLVLTFNNPLQKTDFSKITLTDTGFNILPQTNLSLDSSHKQLTLNFNWQPGAAYYLLMAQDAFVDSAGNSLSKADSIVFTTKTKEDYGNLVLHFTGLDTGLHPRILLLQGEVILVNEPLTAATWSKTLLSPGEYSVRVLYDANNNAVWDPGNYETLQQPEKNYNLPQKITIRSNWDNELDINIK